jgi:hypothetical protein
VPSNNSWISPSDKLHVCRLVRLEKVAEVHVGQAN